MARTTLEITLTLRGPVLSKASSPGAYGLDAAMARHGCDGRPYLPGTLVLGKLRQAWCELSEASGGTFIDNDRINLLFGKLSGNRDNGGTVDPARKALQATDFLLEFGSVGDDDRQPLYRIRMDEARGAVAKGAYLVIESPFAPGAEVRFTGTVSYLAGEGQANDLGQKIETGLRWITSFGAERTVGFGQLLDLKVEKKDDDTPSAKEIDLSSETFRLIVHPQDPFCIARRQIDKNLYESEEVIPGGVLKGGFASTWGMLIGKGPNATVDAGFDPTRPELSAAFDQVRFTHAFPVDMARDVRPTCFPLSLVKDAHGVVHDVGNQDGPVLFAGQAPAFSIDWKDSGDVRARFNWPDLARELRVRTAMDRDTRTAKEQQLFAYEMIVPDGHSWEAMIDLSRVPREFREKVARQLADLLAHGITAWGKTKVHARTEIAPASIAEVKSDNGLYFITLQTPALLCDPFDLNEAAGAEELLAAYANVWTELSGGSLELVRYFARQSLAGGYYLHRRFQAGKDYYPWLLTDAGSVFVLKAADGLSDAAAGKVTAWLRQGLPLPDWAKKSYGRDGQSGDHWRNCPFIPENGYGEIAVNLDLNDFPDVEEAANNER